MAADWTAANGPQEDSFPSVPQLTRTERQDGRVSKHMVLNLGNAGVASSSFTAQLPDLEEALYPSQVRGWFLI